MKEKKTKTIVQKLYRLKFSFKQNKKKHIICLGTQTKKRNKKEKKIHTKTN